MSWIAALFNTRYLVTVHWGVADELVNQVIRLCDPATEVLETEAVFQEEPLVIRLSKHLLDKDVVGCKPGYFARMHVSGDGSIGLAFFRET